MLVLAVGLVVGFAAYAGVEWLQTRRFDSIARQFSTRTVVLMAFAIPVNIVLGQTVASALKLPIYLDSIGTILVGVLAGPIAGAATGLLSNLAWTFLLAGTPFGSPFAWPFAIVAVVIGIVAGVAGYAGLFRPRPGAPVGVLVAGAFTALAALGGLVWFAILPFYRDLCQEVAPSAAPGSYCFQLFASGSTVDTLTQAVAWLAVALILVAVVVVSLRLVRDRDVTVAYVLVGGAICGVVSALVASPISAMVFGGVTGSGTDLLVALFQRAGSDLWEAVLQQSLISDPIDKAITFLIVFTVLGALSRRIAARFPQGERALGVVEG
jgi:hypothetical protein